MTQRARFLPALPAWAQPGHPVLRYQLGAASPPRAHRLLRAAGVVIGVLALLALGYWVTTGGLTQPAGAYPIEAVFNTLYLPLLLLQLLTTVLALLLTSGAVSREVQLQHWDNLRATPDGADLLLRTRWAATYYRLRVPLTLQYVGRLILVACLLWDLTAFQGRYLDLLINGVTPPVSVLAAVVLLALQVTAALLLPLTAVGFDAALGLLVSTLFRQRVVNILAQALLVLFRIALTLALLTFAIQALYGAGPIAPAAGWLMVASGSAIGDWGLNLLYLGRSGEIWAAIPYSIFIGAALIAFCFAQAFLADQMLGLAVRRAQRME